MQNITFFESVKKISFFLFIATCGFSASAFENNKGYFIDNSVSEPEALLDQLKFLHSSKVFNLFSHGRSGELYINGDWKNANEIVFFLESKINIQQTHINIYGCEFAKGLKGLSAVTYIENKLGVSLSASNNLTGKVIGNWK